MGNKLKNIISALLIITAFIILVLPGNEKETGGKKRIKFWHVAGKKDDVPYAVKMFNKSQDTVFVEATPIPWNEHEKKVLTSILSENPPDAVMLASTVPKWASRMALVSLDNAIKKDNFDSTQFYPSLWREMKYNNHVFALPAYTASFALFYNKSLFKKAGLDPDNPPKTWHELKEYSKKLTIEEDGDLKQIGFIPNYGNLETSFIMSLELGAVYKNHDGSKVNLTDPKIIKSFEEEINLLNNIPVEKINKFVGGFGFGNQHGFIAEKVAMMIIDNTFIDLIKVYNPGLDYGVVEIPAFEGTDTKSSTGTWWYAIPRGAKEKQAAWDFLKFAVSKEIQLNETFVNEQSLFPTNVYAATDSSFLKQHFAMSVFDKQMRSTESKVILPLVHDVFWREYSQARERALYKIQTPYEALAQAEKTIQSSLSRAVEYDTYVQQKLPFEQF
ncbi:MAG: ABC transporter substrate-binding protein [Ignavibacteria bacterium]|jgi:multiple sugar transport system substrate-binding protein